MSSMTALAAMMLSGLITAAAGARAPSAAATAETPGLTDAAPFYFALSVRDVSASADWYRRALGFELVRAVDLEARGVRIRLLRRPGALLELVESATSLPLSEMQPRLERRHSLHGVFKVGFLVADLDDAEARLARLEIPLRGRIVTESDGSMRSLQVEDPDGNVVQIFELLEPR